MRRLLPQTTTVRELCPEYLQRHGGLQKEINTRSYDVHAEFANKDNTFELAIKADGLNKHEKQSALESAIQQLE